MENRKIYVWSGYGYTLDEIDLSSYENNDITIEELAYIALCQTKGYLIPFCELESDEIKEFESDERFIYVDLSPWVSRLEENQYYFCIENLKCENIEIHS